MFAAAGNHVVALKRLAIGNYELPADLAEGDWRILSPDDLAAVLAKPEPVS
jgi:16S rRNA pseudouridine516 synthase